MKLATVLALLIFGLIVSFETAKADPIKYGVSTIDFPGAAETFGFGINDAGQIVGSYAVGPSPNLFPSYGFLFSAGVFTTIQYPGASYTNLLGINNSDQIVGVYYPQLPFPTLSGFLWSGGVFTPLPFVPSGINNMGQIVGQQYANLGYFAIYNNGSLTYLPPFPGNPTNRDVHLSGINNAGLIVGNTEHQEPPPNQAFVFSGGVYTPITFPEPVSFPSANGINDLGHIVGTYNDSTGEHGYLLSNGIFRTFDVPGADETIPNGINNSGQIVGLDHDPNGFHAFIAPTPEPVSRGLLACGLARFLIWARAFRRDSRDR